MTSTLGFAPARGTVNVSRRYFDDVMVRTKMLDEYDLEASFDSPSARMPKLTLDELLPAARLLAHFSALDRG